jgi:hypothetical protein
MSQAWQRPEYYQNMEISGLTSTMTGKEQCEETFLKSLGDPSDLSEETEVRDYFGMNSAKLSWGKFTFYRPRQSPQEP